MNKVVGRFVAVNDLDDPDTDFFSNGDAVPFARQIIDSRVGIPAYSTCLFFLDAHP
jgi:hypothetical protein